MKKIALLLAVVCLAAAFATVVFAAEDFIAFDFRTQEAIKYNATISTYGISEKLFNDGAYEVYSSNNDPSITIAIRSKNRFEAADYSVIRIDYKIIEGTPSVGQLFFATNTDGFTMGNPGTSAEYTIDTTVTDYQSAVINMAQLPSSQWADEVKTIRLDPVTVPETRVAVRFVGVFPNEEAATAFDYDKWAAENAPYTKEADTVVDTTPADTAPQTADPFTAVAAVMAISAGAALAIKKRR